MLASRIHLYYQDRSFTADAQKLTSQITSRKEYVISNDNIIMLI